jgi:hypothetical protein
MIRILLSFALLFIGFYFGIQAVRSMSGKERWQLTKLVLYSALCSALSIIVMTIIVYTF